jgi:hypothetical protein
VRCACAAVLLNSGELSLNVHAGNLFYEFLHSDDPENRRLAVVCLSMIRNLDTALITAELLDDPSDDIKRDTIYSIDGAKLESTFGRLAELITEEPLRPAISACLQGIGKPAAELIGQHLDTIEYGAAPETFRLLAHLLIETNESGKSARIEQLIAQVSSETARAQLTMDYCATLGSARSDKELTAFAREQLAEYMRQAAFYREQSAKLPEGGQADALRLACDHHFELRLQVLFKVLRLFNGSIDYEKLFQAAASGGENARAEVGEVLEGVLGQADADRIIGLAKPEPTGEAAGLEHFVEVFRGHDSRWVVAGLLWMVGADGYAAHRDFVQDSLRHDEAVVRETALVRQQAARVARKQAVVRQQAARVVRKQAARDRIKLKVCAVVNQDGKVAISDEPAFRGGPNHDGPPPKIFVALEKVFGPEAAPDKAVPIGEIFAALKRLDANKDGKLTPEELFHSKHD